MPREVSLTRDRSGIGPESSRLGFREIFRRRWLLKGGCIVFLLLTAAACTSSRPLAVREQQLSLRLMLPLNDGTREKTVDFIAAGGRRSNGGTVTTPIQAVEKDFGKLLDMLKDTQNLRFSEFEQRFSPMITPNNREKPVIDAMEQYPDDLGRVGYLLQNFWFVFYAKKESPDGDPIPVKEWYFDRLVIFRDQPPK